MSVTIIYYRLSTAERKSVTREQDTWRQYERKLQKAQHEAYMSAIGDMDKGGGTKQEQFARLASLMKERSDPRQFNLEKDWHTLAYLFTGEAKIGKEHRAGETLYNIIYGGLDTAVMTGYGPVRYFDSGLVADSVDALVKADRQVMSQRFDPAQMAQLGIYAAPEERERKAVLGVIEKLAAFFQTAATANEDIIKFAS
jgi:hypothetical protein